MLKKITASALIFAVLMLSACSNGKDNETTTTSAESTSATSGEAASGTTTGTAAETADTDEAAYSAMVERALMTTGDEARMISVLQKAARGEEITVGYIGGSITEGLTAGSELCWAKLTYNWLCEKFPDTKINYVNAGMSGTPSTLGVIRAERDLYSEYTPDIVFIEFAVNDAQDTTSKQCYESLVAKIMQKENNPAVVLLFTVLENGYTCEEHMSAVGNNYSLPMISLRSALQPEFDAGRMVWDDYSDDQSHPNVWGHEMVADLIENYYNKILKNMEYLTVAPEIKPMNETPLFSTQYADVKLLDSTNFTPETLGSFTFNETVLTQFPGGWDYRREGLEPMTLKLTCRSLFMIFRCNNSDKYGTADVYVDGELVISVNSNRTNGWSNPEAQLIFSNTESAEHEITIKMQDDTKYYAIVGFGYCE